ncbi:MAG: GNAT family N-acetyltransferase [Chitinophagaceae bacterium]|nr:MAG: GNAT family N-acetyltransferase [Chitinophagaceae bacterium]
MQPTFVLKEFESLTPTELYAILHLRTDVFVVEQNCAFQDLDYKDQKAYHLMGYIDNKLAAYTRLLPAGVTFDEPSIGRVVTASFIRNSGIGKKLMSESVDAVYRLFGRQPIKIGAQLYLQKFYESFGFQQSSDVYLEDDIEHIHMLLS